MSRRMFRVPLLLALMLVMATGAFAQQASSMNISGVTYTKWLWGNYHYDGSLYNFTTVPGEGWGDNGQGTEIELLLSAKPNRYLEVSGRIHSRFSQNFWTNFGGFGPIEEGGCGGANQGGDCGEFDPRSNQYVKLRGMTVRVTPGFQYLDAVTFGSTDLGMFDPFTMGKIRYIDRDNLSAIIAQGSITPNLRYDAIRVSLPRLFAGPYYNTGEYTSQDGAYGLQLRLTASPMVDLTTIAELVRDVEVSATDFDLDDGRDLRSRYRNDVFGFKADIHPTGPFSGRVAAYRSYSKPNTAIVGGFGLNAYSPVPNANIKDNTYKVNLDITDPFANGLSFNVEYFNIGENYVSILAARRESDVLLTEGHDSTWALNGPENSKYGVFGGEGNRSVIGYGGWQGNAQQVVSLAVDNEFTDFDEPMAETVVGWKGFTFVPRWQAGSIEIAGEYTRIDYNTNWQAWGDDRRNWLNPIYPGFDLYTGVHNFRSPYAPFQDKETDIMLIRGKYTVPVGKGIDVYGKFKHIDETDKRLNDPRFLPFQAGDCPGGGTACSNNRRNYFAGFSTADWYGNPPVITGANGQVGYQWKPFDDISDDDRDMDYHMLQLGAGYQLTDVIYGSLTYEHYDVDLQDGNTAFQAYQFHQMASGQHEKQKLIALLRFPIGGAEAGFNYEYAFGEFDPDFGGGFVPQAASEQVSHDVGVPVGSLGFSGRFGGWNSLETRDFDHQHLKAYFKVRF